MGVPHFDQTNVIQGITIRLYDSLPAHVVDKLRTSSEHPEDNATIRTRREELLNNGLGACYLRDPSIARVVEDALLHFDGARYRLLAWVIMPNHVHILAEQLLGYPLADVVHSWKSFTAHEANKALGRSGHFWYRDYYDRYIRDLEHLGRTIDYIHYNPIKAGLAERPEEWIFSSARYWH